MILMHRRIVLISAILALASILFLGIWGYRLAGNGAELSETERKSKSETILYCAIVFTILVAGAFGSGLARSRTISRELDRMIERTRMGGQFPERSLRRIGVLGEKLKLLHAGLAELSYKQSLKISSLAALKSFLLNNTEMPMVVTDITGKITDIGRKFAEQAQAGPDNIAGKRIREFLADINFQDLVLRLQKNHTLISDVGTDENVSVYPIFNKSNELSNIVFIWAKDTAIFTDIQRKLEEPKKPTSRVSTLLSRFRSVRRSE